MAVKLIGSILIMLGVTGIGIAIGMREKYRLNALVELRQDINAILSKLIYSREIFYNVLKGINEDSKELKLVYDCVLKGLENNNTIELAWRFAFERYKKELYFRESDIRGIIRLGEIFSSSDIDYQSSELKLKLRELDEEIIKSRDVIDRNFKVSRSLSISIAAFIIILLF